MKYILQVILFYILVTPSIGSAQSESADPISPWIGEWSGTLEIMKSDGSKQEVPMKVKHFTTDTVDTYGWFLIYGEDEEKGTRAYYLKAKDKSSGHYVVDEKNGIFLDTYLIGNKMVSTFLVQHSLITSVYTLEEDGGMKFEIFYSNTKDPNTSGGNTEDIPSVESYVASTYQFARLQKVE